MQKNYAFALKSTFSLPQIFARLNEVGPWKWSERDNHYYGDYLTTRPLKDPHYGFVRIYEEKDGYTVTFNLESDASDAQALFDAVTTTVLSRMLPAIEATDIRPTEYYD